MVRVRPLPLQGAALVSTEPFLDHRGQFARFFCDQALASLLKGRTIRQINLSSNQRKGTLRGLHFQKPPHTDMKFIRCLRGRTYHVVVDIRSESPTFLRWSPIELDAANMEMICVPEGFAHGFQSLEDDSEVMYFVTCPYAAAHQGGLRYDDPALGINWPLEVAELSDRDAQHALISQRGVAA